MEVLALVFGGYAFAETVFVDEDRGVCVLVFVYNAAFEAGPSEVFCGHESTVTGYCFVSFAGRLDDEGTDLA